MVPSAFLLYVSGAFLQTDVDSWFNPEYERVLDDSLEIAQTYYLNSANNATHYARVLAEQIAANKLLAPDRRDQLKHWWRKSSRNTTSARSRSSRSTASCCCSRSVRRLRPGSASSPDSQLLATTLTGSAMTRTDRFGKADMIRGTAPIYASPDSDNVVGAVVVDYYLPESLAKPAAGISKTFEDYFQLRILQPADSAQLLAGVGPDRAGGGAAGELVRDVSRARNYRPDPVDGGGDARRRGGQSRLSNPSGRRRRDRATGAIVQQMTTDLRVSPPNWNAAAVYTETLLRNVSAGVVGLDPEGKVTTINPCAERLLGPESRRGAAGAPGNRCLRPRWRMRWRSCSPALPPAGGLVSIKLETNGGETELMMTASAAERGRRQSWHGAVFRGRQPNRQDRADGSVARSRAPDRARDQESADSDPAVGRAPQAPVPARRSDDDAALLEECTRTIISEVEDLKRLVNEFSVFARMPHLNPMPGRPQRPG